MPTITELRAAYGLIKPTPLLSAQVQGVADRLVAAGFLLAIAEDGSGFAAVRKGAERGLCRVVRYSDSMWLTFVGWPPRTGTLAEVRAWCDTFGGSR